MLMGHTLLRKRSVPVTRWCVSVQIEMRYAELAESEYVVRREDEKSRGVGVIISLLLSQTVGPPS